MMAIKKLREIQLQPVAVVCDEVSTNRSLYASSGVTRDQPYQGLGGPGIVVEIDENLFCRRKQHVGGAVREQWVFGWIKVGTQSRKGFLVAVARRNAYYVFDNYCSTIGDRVARPDVWKFICHFSSAGTMDTRPLYSVSLSELSTCIFKCDSGDLAMQREVKQVHLAGKGPVPMSPTTSQARSWRDNVAFAPGEKVYISLEWRMGNLDSESCKGRRVRYAVMCLNVSLHGSIWKSTYVHSLALLTALSNLCMRFCI